MESTEAGAVEKKKRSPVARPLVLMVLSWAIHLGIFPCVIAIAVNAWGPTGVVLLAVGNAVILMFTWASIYPRMLTFVARQEAPPEVDAQLQSVVEKLATKAGRKIPGTGVVDTILGARYQACALPLPRPGYVLATRELMAELTPEELEGVVAHELSHIWFNPPFWKFFFAAWSVLTSTLTVVLFAFALFGPTYEPSHFLYSWWLVVLLAFFGQVAFSLLPLAIHRMLERQADEKACELGCRGDCLAIALWDMSAREAEERGGGKGSVRTVIGRANRRTWTADHRRAVLERLCRQDAVIHVITQMAVGMLSSHPTLGKRTAYLLGNE